MCYTVVKVQVLEGYWPRDNVLHCCVGTSVGGVLAAWQCVTLLCRYKCWRGIGRVTMCCTVV